MTSFLVEVQLREMALWQCMTFEKVGKRWEFYSGGIIPTKMGIFMSPIKLGSFVVKSSGGFFGVWGGQWPVSLTKVYLLMPF